MRIAALCLAAFAVATPAAAGGLNDIFGKVQTQAKAGAVDAAVESQAPGLSVLTDKLSDEQKAQVFDFAVENSDTIGQVAGATGGVVGGGGLGTAATILGGSTAAAPAPAPVYGTATPAPVYTTPAPVYSAPAPAPVYESVGSLDLIQPQ